MKDLELAKQILDIRITRDRKIENYDYLKRSNI